MITKIFNYALSARHQFFKYFFIGISGTVLDILSLFILENYWHFRPFIAVIINQILLFIYIFLLNKFWTFKAIGMSHRQVVRFIAVFAMNYIFAIGWMWLWTEHFLFNYLMVRVINIALCVCWNFFLYKHWVYASVRQK